MEDIILPIKCDTVRTIRTVIKPIFIATAFIYAITGTMWLFANLHTNVTDENLLLASASFFSTFTLVIFMAAISVEIIERLPRVCCEE